MPLYCTSALYTFSYAVSTNHKSRLRSTIFRSGMSIMKARLVFVELSDASEFLRPPDEEPEWMDDMDFTQLQIDADDQEEEEVGMCNRELL